MKYNKFVILVVLLAFTGFGFKCNKSESKDESTFTGGYSDRHQTRTVKGTIVAGYKMPKPETLVQVDLGLNKVFDVSKWIYGYANYLNHADYRVYIFPRDSRCTNPGFTLPADGSDWDGTEYDKDPRPGKVLLCVAGMNVDQVRRGMLIVDDVATTLNVTRFEAEHLILLYNDIDKYNETSGVHAHPLLPDESGLAVEEGQRFTAWSYEMPEAVKVVGTKGFQIEKGSKICVLLTK